MRATPIAAVAAISEPRSPRRPLALIKVDYEVLPHVIDVDEAMARTRRCCSRT